MSVENENCVISPLSSSLIQYVLGFILFILLISKSDIKGLLKTQEHSFDHVKLKFTLAFITVKEINTLKKPLHR